jgi:hypothetical protein
MEMRVKVKVKVNGGEQGGGDERKKGDDSVKGLCVSSDTPELFTFTSGEAKAPSPAISNTKNFHNDDRPIKSMKLVGIFLFCQVRRRDIK